MVVSTFILSRLGAAGLGRRHGNQRLGQSRLLASLLALGCAGGTGLGILAPRPGMAAERVIFSISVLSETIAVEDLAHYAATGKARGTLAGYLRLLKPDDRAQFRSVLTAKADLSVVAVAQFLYSPQGELLLRRVGEVIKTEAGLSGFSGLRAAFILAAADPEGLSLLGVLQKFPIQGLRVDLDQTWAIASELNGLLQNTKKQTRALESQAESAPGPGVDFALLSNLRQRGPFGFSKQTLTLQDAGRSRQFEVDLYLPKVPVERAGLPLPVVVISHGLGSDRTTFGYLAQHLVSHGYAVAVPEHPKSNTQQIANLLAGRVNEVAEPSEFVDRPLDISYLLDELGRLKLVGPKLDLQHVGMIGQSFGGYTALAIAGAPVQTGHLAKACVKLERSWNVSLALQCRAQVAIIQDRNFRDSRVVATIAINPITSAMFSVESLGQIAVPTLLVAGDADTIAPAILEQYPVFKALPESLRHLLIMRRGTHFSTVEDGGPNNPFPAPAQVVGPDPAMARRYMNAVGLAFMDRYVRQMVEREVFLSNGYVRSIQQGPLGLSWVR